MATKPAFRVAVHERRCIVPGSRFYEWFEGENDAVAIVSTEAGPGMADTRHREPVVLECADWPLWLGEAGHGVAVLIRAWSEAC